MHIARHEAKEEDKGMPPAPNENWLYPLLASVALSLIVLRGVRIADRPKHLHRVALWVFV